MRPRNPEVGQHLGNGNVGSLADVVRTILDKAVLLNERETSKPLAGRARTLAEPERGVLHELDTRDQRAATWVDNAYGVLQAVNTSTNTTPAPSAGQPAPSATISAPSPTTSASTGPPGAPSAPREPRLLSRPAPWSRRHLRFIEADVARQSGSPRGSHSRPDLLVAPRR